MGSPSARPASHRLAIWLRFGHRHSLANKPVDFDVLRTALHLNLNPADVRRYMDRPEVLAVASIMRKPVEEVATWDGRDLRQLTVIKPVLDAWDIEQARTGNR